MTVQYRGTSNTNDRGSAEARRRRKTWLFEVWGADVDVVTREEFGHLWDGISDAYLAHFTETWMIWVETTGLPEQQGVLEDVLAVHRGLGRPAVRCFRCGDLLDWESVEIDRIKPGCEGGRYTKNNIRPICERDNKILSGEHVKRRNAKRKTRNAAARERRARIKATMAAGAEVNASSVSEAQGSAVL